MGDRDAERLGGLQVDLQIKFRRPLDRQIGGLGALQDAVDEVRRSMATRRNARPVTHEYTGICCRRLAREARQPMLQCKLGSEPVVPREERTLRSHDRLRATPDRSLESVLEIFGSLHFNHLEFQADLPGRRLEVAHDEIVVFSR